MHHCHNVDIWHLSITWHHDCVRNCIAAYLGKEETKCLHYGHASVFNMSFIGKPHGQNAYYQYNCYNKIKEFRNLKLCKTASCYIILLAVIAYLMTTFCWDCLLICFHLIKRFFMSDWADSIKLQWYL